MPIAWRCWRNWIQPSELWRTGLLTPRCRRPCTASSLQNRCFHGESARRIGFDSVVNVDRYTVCQSRRQVQDPHIGPGGQLRPDRIAFYAYAHLPERLGQRRIVWALTCPWRHPKVSMLARSLEAFSTAGYVYVGMDHFTAGRWPWPNAREGCITQLPGLQHAQPDCDLIGLGVSAIGRVGTLPIVRMPRHWKTTTTCSTRAVCLRCVVWRSRAMIWCAAPSSWPCVPGRTAV